MNKIILFFVLQFFVLVQLALGADCYSDKLNGSDANAGTEFLPKQNHQSCLNISAYGDTLHIANTSEMTTAQLNYGTGFNSSSPLHRLKIKAWDNGGSITIQRPDEASPRIGAVLNGLGTANTIDAGASANVTYENIRFINTTSRLLYLGEGSACNGCEFTGTVPVALELNGNGGSFENGYVHDFVTSFYAVVSGAGNHKIINNYFDNNSAPQGEINSGGYYAYITRNKFKKNLGQKSIIVGSGFVTIENNSFESDGDASAIGIEATFATQYSGFSIMNNVFYNYDGAGAKPIDFTSSSQLTYFGHNGYYDCNASDALPYVFNDLSVTDEIGSGSPYVDSANGDWTPIEDLYYQANDGTDSGAVQHIASGGGGGSNSIIFTD